MLTDLVAEGLGVIDRAEISLERGCTALTGETGAGKTLVVTAVGLLLGAKADRVLVRSGAPEARIEGRFLLPEEHPALAILKEQGLASDADRSPGNGEIIASRSLFPDGRPGKVRLNGRLVPLQTLAALGPLLVDIAGQQQHQRVSLPAWQRSALDAFAGHRATELAREVAAATRAATEARRRRDGLRAAEAERHREMDMLRYQVSEIAAAAPTPGEAEGLRAEVARLEQAEAIGAALTLARDHLGGDRGAVELVESAAQELRAAAGHEPALAEAVDRLEEVVVDLNDVAAGLARRVVAADPQARDAIRERLAAISGLTRKYGDNEDEVLAYLERARERLSVLEGLDADLEGEQRRAQQLEERARSLAAALGRERKRAAPELERALKRRLEELALEDARISVALEPCDLYEGGTERVELRFSADPAASPRPLARVASGGELSRVALALHLETVSGTPPTMIFDEVDAGVGGRAAQEVGRALADLARLGGSQVVVVTHLPQVAAFADDHLTVVKTSTDTGASAAIRRLTGRQRVTELSRMLAGLPESERAQQHAEELLEIAGGSAW
jgi:DNA repair protein RecN (Recombination protein N)